MCSKYTCIVLKYQKILTSSAKGKQFVPESGSELYVRNVPTDCDVWELANFFEVVGEVFQIRLMLAENLNETRGFAYVSFVNATLARTAVQKLNRTPFRQGRFIFLENSVNNCRIFIGGIPTNKTKDEIWQELIRHGINDIVDVIMYRAYTHRSENRGYVFVEFKTHECAAHFRAKYGKNLKLWDNVLIVDWSIPLPEIDTEELQKVTKLHLSNLDVLQTVSQLKSILLKFVKPQNLEKVYKFKNYAFVHLNTRREAERLLNILKDYFNDSVVEVDWAKPTNRYDSPEYRRYKFGHTRTVSRHRNDSTNSSSYSSSPTPEVNSMSPWSTSSSPGIGGITESMRELSLRLPTQEVPRFPSLRYSGGPSTSTSGFGIEDKQFPSFSPIYIPWYDPMKSISNLTCSEKFGASSSSLYSMENSPGLAPSNQLGSEARIIPRNLGFNIYDFIGDILD